MTSPNQFIKVTLMEKILSTKKRRNSVLKFIPFWVVHNLPRTILPDERNVNISYLRNTCTAALISYRKCFAKIMCLYLREFIF